MSAEAPHHDLINIIALDKEGGHYVYWVNRLTEDDLHSKADIAAVLAWYRRALAAVRAELDSLKRTKLSGEECHGHMRPQPDKPYPKFVPACVEAEAEAARLLGLIKQAVRELTDTGTCYDTLRAALAQEGV